MAQIHHYIGVNHLLIITNHCDNYKVINTQKTSCANDKSNNDTIKRISSNLERLALSFIH